MSNTIQEQGPKTYTLMRERVEAVRARDGATSEPASEDGPPDTATILRGLTGKLADATLLAGTVPLPRFAPTADVENDGDRGPALRKTRAEEQAECDRANESIVTVLYLRDPEGEQLRIETDMRDRRSYVTIGEPDAERPFELGPQDATKIIGALSETPRPWLDRTSVQQAVAPVKKASPRVLTDADRQEADRNVLRERFNALLPNLSPEEVQTLSWRLSQYPIANLVRRLEAITAEAVAGPNAPKDWTKTSSTEEQALAAELAAQRAAERLLLPPEKHTPRHTVHDYTSGAVAAEHHRVSER